MFVFACVVAFDYFSACDDSQHVYSGHSLGVDELGSLDNWKGTLQLKVPTVTKVLAVSCRNKGGPAGILGSTNDGRILTNSQWKCSNTFEENWNSANFDDSNWAPGVQVNILMLANGLVKTRVIIISLTSLVSAQICIFSSITNSKCTNTIRYLLNTLNK